MVLNTDLKEIMMDHALRTISYIADIGELVVLMARRRCFLTHQPSDSTTETSLVPSSVNGVDKTANNRTPKMICHVFESDEVRYYLIFLNYNCTYLEVDIILVMVKFTPVLFN